MLREPFARTCFAWGMRVRVGATWPWRGGIGGRIYGAGCFPVESATCTGEPTHAALVCLGRYSARRRERR